MKLIKKEDLSPEVLPGRHIWKAIGKDGFSISGRMTIGFARFSAEIGPAEPHHHAEESVYVLDAQRSWVCWGSAKDQLNQRLALQPGTLIHIPALEWHVFECEPGGYLEILFFYGQVDNIRPEEIKTS
ncbi:MAG: hypothetical protein HPY45_09370 [Anaerolineae bacterium]|nr:hypothetical protein [Anaerolineae bacterium]